ncbi:hypothetical protein P3342_007843 [Pyrenophora teres f. teres]|nr:hypothetical protein P3342_007843 [Pyrenophora teres f. teres]
MDKPLYNPSVDLPGVNGSEATNGTNVTNGEAEPHKKEAPGLIETAKAAAVEVTNGIKSLAVSN